MTTYGRRETGGTDRAAAPGTGRISWSAVLAGMVIVLFMQMILGLLGIGLGMTAPAGWETSVEEAAGMTGTPALWGLFSGVAAAFLGGLAAGRLSAMRRRPSGAMHGLVSWAAAALVVYYLLSTAFGGLVGGAFSPVASAFPSGTASVAAAEDATVATPGAALPSALAGLDDATAQAVSDEVSAILGDVNAAADEAAADPAARRELETSVERFLGALAAGEPADRRPLRAVLENLTGLPPEQADETLDGWENRIETVLRRAGQAAAERGQALAFAAFWAAAILLLGAVAGTVGGAVATPRNGR